MQVVFIFADEAGEESVEDVCARAQQVVAEAEELLVDAEWSAPKPVAVGGHRPMATAVATLVWIGKPATRCTDGRLTSTHP